MESIKTTIEITGYKLASEDEIKMLSKLDVVVYIKRYKLIKKDKLKAFVFVETGQTSFFELVDCQQTGFDDYFKKPADIKTHVKFAKNIFAKIER